VFILVDAGNFEGSKFVKKHYPSVKIIKLFNDKGYTYALLRGCRIASGEYILTLNNDTVLLPSTISKLVKELKKDENCVVIPIRLFWDGKYGGKGSGYRWIVLYIPCISCGSF
jgi:GT2 family glycosyltransferase